MAYVITPITGLPATTPVSTTTFTPSGTPVQQASTVASGPVTGALVGFPFYATPGASASATAMNRAGPDTAVPVVALYRGSIVGMTLSASASKGGGTCSLTARVNSSATDVTFTWDGSTTQSALFERGAYAFERDDSLDVTYATDSGYTPTTTKLEVILWVVLEQQESV